MFDFLENFSLIGILSLIFSPISMLILLLITILAILLYIYYFMNAAFSEQKIKHQSFSLERVREVDKETKNKK